MSRRLKVKPGVLGTSTFYKLAVQNIRFFGRMYEPLLFAMTNLFTGNPTRDLKKGVEMFKKGKLKIVPSFKGAFVTMGIFSKVGRKER